MHSLTEMHCCAPRPWEEEEGEDEEEDDAEKTDEEEATMTRKQLIKKLGQLGRCR